MAASTSAPTAPIAPASVGVARPMKIVPSTRKISTSEGTMPQRHLLQASAQPLSVRASGGRAGTSGGAKMLRIDNQAKKSSTWRMQGPIAPAYMSPTELAELVGQHDQHQGRRDELGDRAGGGDDARGLAARRSRTHHDRQGDQAHGDHRGGHRAGDGAEHGAHDDHRIGQPAAHGRTADPMPSSRSSASPQRSRMAPMSVKNGIASSRSLEMPKTSGRSGCRERSAGSGRARCR